jgi:hypothetical protein
VGCRLFAGFGVSGVGEGSGPSAGPGASESSGLSVDFGVSGDSEVLFGVFESPGGSGVGNGPASGDGSGVGSSKAGRAWCQGASVLRGGREAVDSGSVGVRLAEPSAAVSVRRGSVGGSEGVSPVVV